jgi:hypothetical protein
VIARWKTERYHYVEKMTALILLYSIIAGKTPNMRCMGRLEPEAVRLPGPDEWKPLYGIADKRKKGAKKPYTMKEAVEYQGWPKRSPSDAPGVQTMWIGLMKRCIPPTYRDRLA